MSKTQSKLGVTIPKIPDATPVTYAELATLISGSDLVAGRKYLITDFTTTHTIPGTVDLNTGSLEPIIVTAVDSNSLASLAFSTTFPNDILYYNVSNIDQSKVQNQTKGFINRRIDTENNIDVPFDFRNVKFRRWEIDVPDVWDIATSYAINSVVVGSDNNVYVSMIAANLANDPIVESYHWFKFPFANGAFVSHLSTGIQMYNSPIPVSTNYQDRLINAGTNTIISYGGSSVNANKIERFNVVFNTLCTNVNINSLIATGTIDTIKESVINTVQFTIIYSNLISQSFFTGAAYNQLCAYRIDDTKVDGTIQTSNIKDLQNCFFDATSAVTGSTLNFGINSNFIRNIFCGAVHAFHILYGDNLLFTNNTIRDLESTLTGVSFLAATQVFNDYTKTLFQRSDGTARLSYVDNTDTVIYTAVNA